MKRTPKRWHQSPGTDQHAANFNSSQYLSRSTFPPKTIATIGPDPRRLPLLTQSAPAALAAFRAARARTVDTIKGLSPDQLARRGVMEGYRTLSLRGLLHYLSSHDQQHLAGLQWLLGKIASLGMPS